jgi:SM-20-related protein
MPNQDEISVTLLLQGGHSRTIFLRRNDPLLNALLTAMNEKSQGSSRPGQLLNIRVDEGRHSLIIAATDVVALLTDPPLVSDVAAQRAATLPAPQAAVGGGIAKSPYVLLENFLEPALHAELIAYVGARQKDFVPSTVSTADSDYRRSMVLHEFPKFAEIFRSRVRSLTPRLAQGLGVGELAIDDIESQLTTSNDGDYFRMHNDSGSPDTVSRALTYVYYFNKEPKGYSGGVFRLFNSRLVDGRYECGDKAADLEPKNNSILFFPSFCNHEVLPVSCPSKKFIDGRFTINGWVRRAASGRAA